MTLALLMVLVGAPPMVHQVTHIEPDGKPTADDVSKLRRAVKEAFTKGTGFRLKQTGFAELEKGDFRLVVQGRFIKEADRFSVYLSFGPGRKNPEAPSFFASETSEPGGPGTVMIGPAGRRAAGRLARVVKRWWRGQAGGKSVVWQGTETLWTFGPWSWSRPKVDEGPISVLLDVTQPDDARFEAFRTVAKRAFDDPDAQNALLGCVLWDPTSRLRKSCVEALESPARASTRLHRGLLYALRYEVDDNVLDALMEISESFVGLSRLDTVATWMHLVTSEATTEGAAEDAARLLAKEENLPNLAMTVAACLQQDSLIERKRYACARDLVQKLPFKQRRAAVARYLVEAPVYSDAQRRTYKEVLESVFYRQKDDVGPVWGGLLLQMAERKSAFRARPIIIARVGRHAPATAKTLARLVHLGRERYLAESVIRALTTLAERNPGLGPAVEESLRGLQKNGHWGPRPNRQDPRRAFRDAQKRLKYLAKKQQKKRRRSAQ